MKSSLNPKQAKEKMKIWAEINEMENGELKALLNKMILVKMVNCIYVLPQLGKKSENTHKYQSGNTLLFWGGLHELDLECPFPVPHLIIDNFHWLYLELYSNSSMGNLNDLPPSSPPRTMYTCKIPLRHFVFDLI